MSFLRYFHLGKVYLHNIFEQTQTEEKVYKFDLSRL